MKKIFQKLVLLWIIVILGQCVPPIFSPSDKYLKTGVIQITLTPFLTGVINNGYSATLSGCAFPSNVYTVGLGLYSLDIKFDGLRMLYDIQITSTSVSGFEINFSTTMGNLISLLKVCYVIKNPSYTDLFYIQNFRYTGPSFILISSTPHTQTLTLTTSFPASSIGSIDERTFLYCFNFQSKDTGIQNNIDVYPSTMIIDQSTIELKIQTLYDDVKVAFYALTIVLFDSSQVTASALSRFTLAEIDSPVSDSDLFIDTSPIKMFSYNTYVGLKAFHARTLQTPNFLNFQTSFPSETLIQFQSANNINWKYMKFQILISEAAACPSTEPYFIYYLGDCQASIPAGYVQNCQGNVLLDFQMNLKYLIKNPQKNQVQILFNLEPTHPSLNSVMSQTNWNNALNIDIPGTKTIEYISSPNPQLKIAIDYFENLQSLQKSITISAYDPTIHPASFKGLSQSKISLKMSSSNNLAINLYDDSTYNKSRVFNYIFLALSCFYMLFFLIGFIAGKVYILQMAFAPQVAFLSLVSLDNISPTMSSLSYLRYIFGYWYPGNNGTVFSQEGRNFMKLMGISDDFLLNYNVMFIFVIITYILGVVFHFMSKPKAKRFFLFDTPLYLILWFGKWILFTGQIQIRALVIQQGGTALSYCGLVFFILCLLNYFGNGALYFKKLTEIETFYSVFSVKTQNHVKEQKSKYFYLILFLQRIILASLFAHVFIFNYLNIILIAIHILIIALIVALKPYKFRAKLNQEKQKISLLRPNIRQIINYSILIIILVFLFITNQIQQSQFKLHIPIIVMILLFINIISTVFFLIYDKRLKQDFQQLKKLFDPQQQKQTKKTVYQKPQQTQRKIKDQDIKVGIISDPSPKDTLMYKKSDFDRSFQVSFSPLKKTRQPNHNDLRLFAQQNQREQFSIDEQLMKVAQKNQEMYRKKANQGNGDQYSPYKQVAKIKSYHSIMKGSGDKKGLSYQKHQNYFNASEQEN